MDFPAGARGGVRGRGQRGRRRAAVAPQHRAAQPTKHDVRASGAPTSSVARADRRTRRVVEVSPTELSCRSWRTRRDRCTTPTRTSWSRPTGSIRTSTPRTANGSRSCWTAPTSDTTPADAIARPRHAPRSRSTAPTTPRRSRCARTSSRPARSSSDDRPARARPARLREPARVRHVHEPARAALRSRRRSRARRSQVARAQHRAVLDWCSVDPRLLPVTVVPRRRHGRRGRADARGDRRGRGRDLDRPVLPPATRRATSISNRCGRCAAEAGVPVVLHVAGAGANVMTPDFFDNGLPPVPDFHGGDTQLQVDRLPVDPAAGDADAERADRSTAC